MARLAKAGMLLIVAAAGCTADPAIVAEPDAAGLEDAPAGGDANVNDGMPLDSAVRAPSSDVRASACGCSFATEPVLASAANLLGLLALAALRRRAR